MTKAGARKNARIGHGALMAMWCLAPMAVLGALIWLGVIGSWGLYLFFVFCPVSHFLLMRKMGNGHLHGSGQSRIEDHRSRWQFPRERKG